jgi:hypothetical protein
MSALTEFLHKLVDKAGISELHSDIDALDNPADVAENTGGEDTLYATE